MTLALLLTAVGGAWAQDYDINVDFNSTYDRMGTTFNCMIMNLIDPGVGVKGTLELSVDDVSKGSFGVDGEMVFGSIAAIDAGDHTWTAEFKPEGGGSFKRHGDFRIDKVHTSISYDGSTSINMGVGESTELDVHVAPDGADGLSYSSSDASVVSITKENSFRYIIQAEAAGTATITFSFAGNINYNAAEDLTITVTVAAPEPTVEVTTDAAEEGATFTEASFDMQTFDVDVDYELVRDMAVQMTTKVGDGAEGADYRIRLKKNGGKWELADLNVQQVKALFKVHDAIENKDLAFSGDSAVCAISIYALDADDKPTGDAIAFADLAPGRYVAIAKAADSTAYDGQTAQSNVIVLFQGYPVKVPGKEFVTYYRDEALGLLDEEYLAGAALYTITAVADGKATATLLDITNPQPPLLQIAPANTPLLIYNSSDDTLEVKLIPTTTSTTINYYSYFTGVLEPTTLTGDDGFYAFNGKQFVYVRKDLTLPANKCCLKIKNTSGGLEQGARSISIVFEDATTGLKEIDNGHWSMDNGQWYDLNGRKLNAAPKRKGVYIKNGRKVVMK